MTGDGASPPPDPDRPEPEGPGVSDFLALGMGVALCIVLAAGGGYLLDATLGTSPLFTFAGLAFGIACAVLLTVAKVRRNL
ncbi:MAG: AtpZ/AtpI family protein [Actinomycetota bacterium]|jgi:F0F1-type ATP synthase assembly protein I|nr:AtpZ/AtpI family protein [Actinomycetota bacterium]